MRIVSVAAAVLFLAAVPARAELLIAIDKAQQQMTVSINGAPTYHWTVSTGKPGYDTPGGSFTAQRQARVYYSKKYDDAPMPNSVFFYGGYAIHGTYEQSRLGSPVSHGCVRLALANAATLYALVSAHGLSNTRVSIHDGGMRRPAPRSVPMASARDRGFERPVAFDRGGAYRGIERDQRGYGDDRFYQRVQRSAPRIDRDDRGFEQFGAPSPAGRRQQAFAGPRERAVSRNDMTEAEMRDFARRNGFRW